MTFPDEPDEFYLERGPAPIRPARPLLQGDVLTDVPLALIKRFKEDRSISGTENPVLVALLGHPCSSYSRGSLVPVQTVAQVRPLEEADTSGRFRAPWDSHIYLFPLPQLIEGVDFVVDFRRVGVTHFDYLRDQRIACLSFRGWAAFQARYAAHSLRLELTRDVASANVRVYWHEFEIWEKWVLRDRPPADYQEWLDRPFVTGPYEGVIRRDVLEYAPDHIEQALDDEGES